MSRDAQPTHRHQQRDSRMVSSPARELDPRCGRGLPAGDRTGLGKYVVWNVGRQLLLQVHPVVDARAGTPATTGPAGRRGCRRPLRFSPRRREAPSERQAVRGRTRHAGQTGQPLGQPEHLRARPQAQPQPRDRGGRAAIRRSASAETMSPCRSTTSTWHASPPSGRSRGRAWAPRRRARRRTASATAGIGGSTATGPSGERPAAGPSDASSPDQRRGAAAAYAPRTSVVQRHVAANAGSPYQASRSANASFAHSTTAWT